MWYKLRKFQVLTLQQKKLFLEACATLSVVRAALLFFSFKQLVANLGFGRKAAVKDDITAEQIFLAGIIGDVIVMAANNTPWSSPCLVQSFAAQRMLYRRGIPGALYLGTAKGDGQNRILVHAWTQCGDTVLTGNCDNRSFAVLSVFTWE